MTQKTVELKKNKTAMDNFNDFLLKDNSFIILAMLAAAAIFAGTFLYLKFNTGVFSDLAVAQMLQEGVTSGDYSGAAGFAAGFLIARVLEGPLVGVLDIGGSLMTGVGIGIPALLLSMNINLPFDNFLFAMITGAVLGLIIGALIMLIRKTVPQGVSVGGTEIMMGAGNTAGRYLGPMIIIAAGQHNPWTGFGALLGAALFYKFNKEITGGAILGAMLFGAIFL